MFESAGSASGWSQPTKLSPEPGLLPRAAKLARKHRAKPDEQQVLITSSSKLNKLPHPSTVATSRLPALLSNQALHALNHSSSNHRPQHQQVRTTSSPLVSASIPPPPPPPRVLVSGPLGSEARSRRSVSQSNSCQTQQSLQRQPSLELVSLKLEQLQEPFWPPQARLTT